MASSLVVKVSAPSVLRLLSGEGITGMVSSWKDLCLDMTALAFSASGDDERDDGNVPPVAAIDDGPPSSAPPQIFMLVVVVFLFLETSVLKTTRM